MPTFVKFRNAPINPTLLAEELAPLGLVVGLWAGFEQVGELYQPNPDPKIIATNPDPALEVTSQPGELHLGGDVDPGAALDALLANHDPTQLSTEQKRLVARAADRVQVQTAVGKATPMTSDDLKALARLALEEG